MEREDPDTLLAYYMMCNHGWRPKEVSDLPTREKILLTLFALKEIKSRKKQEGGG